MTFKEKLMQEHPQYVDKTYKGGCVNCPDAYGYEPERKCTIRALGGDDGLCAECWNREILGTEEIEDIKGNVIVTTLPYKPNEPRILDSGDRTEFETGAVRDMREGKGRCDLLPLDVISDYFYYMSRGEAKTQEFKLQRVFGHISNFMDEGEIDNLFRAINAAEPFRDTYDMLLEVAKHFEEGAKKYGDNNWRKGIPVRCYIDSAVRHYLKYLRGDKDEPHDRAFCWNILCAIWTCKHMPELNDYRKEEKDGEPT